MNKVIALKFTIMFVVFFMANSLATSIVLAFEHVDFKELSREDWVVIICAIVVNFTNTMMAFMHKYLGKYIDEILPDNNNSTTVTQNTVTTVEKVSVPSIPIQQPQPVKPLPSNV